MKIYNIKLVLSTLLLSSLFIACDNDDDDIIGNDDTPSVDFSGTFAQRDSKGRAGVNTVFGVSDARKDQFNVSTPIQQATGFAGDFTNMINGYHTAFGVAYENNILGLDAATLGAVFALDVLQVAPNDPTAYFTSGTNFLTGRRLQDDVVDIALILTFGGNTGARFNGDGGTPELVSDNVGSGNRNFGLPFPYLEDPNQ